MIEKTCPVIKVVKETRNGKETRELRPCAEKATNEYTFMTLERPDCRLCKNCYNQGRNRKKGVFDEARKCEVSIKQSLKSSTAVSFVGIQMDSYTGTMKDMENCLTSLAPLLKPWFPRFHFEPKIFHGMNTYKFQGIGEHELKEYISAFLRDDRFTCNKSREIALFLCEAIAMCTDANESGESLKLVSLVDLQNLKSNESKQVFRDWLRRVEARRSGVHVSSVFLHKLSNCKEWEASVASVLPVDGDSSSSMCCLSSSLPNSSSSSTDDVLHDGGVDRQANGNGALGEGEKDLGEDEGGSQERRSESYCSTSTFSISFEF
jgi:hypothetical protein